MNVLKNMEFVFVVGFGLACSAAYVSSPAPAPQPGASVAYADGKMAVVIVSAKRMTAAQKIQSLQEERQQSALLASVGPAEKFDRR